jgi:hypothetical protein
MLFKGAQGSFGSGKLKIEHGSDVNKQPAKVFFGSCTTRATVAAEAAASGEYVPIGSVYFSDAGKIYVRTAYTTAGATNTDWQKVTATAAD